MCAGNARCPRRVPPPVPPGDGGFSHRSFRRPYHRANCETSLAVWKGDPAVPKVVRWEDGHTGCPPGPRNRGSESICAAAGEERLGGVAVIPWRERRFDCLGKGVRKLDPERGARLRRGGSQPYSPGRLVVVAQAHRFDRGDPGARPVEPDSKLSEPKLDTLCVYKLILLSLYTDDGNQT